MGRRFLTTPDMRLSPDQTIRRSPAPGRNTARCRTAHPDLAAHEYKIVVEIAGTELQSCGCGYLLAAAVKDSAGRVIDHPKVRPLTNTGREAHRHLVELRGLTADTRCLYIKTGCHEAADGACLIPLQSQARPVPADTREITWPTVLIPVVLMAYDDESNRRDKARRLRSGWLYIYVNGHLWRELYVTAHGMLRDVNLGLPHVAGSDVRESSGHAMSAVLVPHTIAGRKQRVQMAFAEVQWPWRTVCAMGGPADDDMRFLPQVIAAARRIAVDTQRRARRFLALDFAGYPDSLDSSGGPVGPIESVPGLADPGGDPLAAVRHKKIAAVYLQDPLGIARRLAGQYQERWRDMQNLLAELAGAPRRALKQKTYEPDRWFDAAVLANHFFFAPFPDFASWQRLHPAANQDAWQKAKDRHARMRTRLDKTAIDQALGTKRRQDLRPKIDKARRRLVKFLQDRTRDPLDLLVLMLDDYFTLPNTAGKENTSGHNRYGYVDGWGVVERLIARLGDHSFTLDMDLETEAADIARLTRDNPGLTFLNHLADPDCNHPLHARLFPRPAINPLTPDTRPVDNYSPVFKPQRFKTAQLADMAPVAGFISHFAKSALIADHPRIRHSLLRLANAACKLQLEQTRISGEALERQAADRHRSFVQKSADLQSASQGTLDDSQLADLMGTWFLFARPDACRNARKTPAATSDKPSVGCALPTQTSVQDLPRRWRLTAGDLQDHEIDRIVSARSARVKEPLPESDLGYISFPQGGPLTRLHLVSPPSRIIGRPTIEELRRGNLRAGRQSRLDRKTPWYQTAVELIASTDAGLFARLCRQMKATNVARQVIIPLAVVFETWNYHQVFSAVTEKIGGHGLMESMGEAVGAVFDFSALNTALLFHRVPTAAERNVRDGAAGAKAMPDICPSRALGNLGVTAGSHSACLSARDLLMQLRPAEEGAAARDDLLANLFLGASQDTVWTSSFFAAAASETACPPCWAHTQSPLLWTGLGAVLAGLALLLFTFKPDPLLQEWLMHGPFSLNDPPGRFAGHRPGDTDFGPPPGGEQRQQNFPGTSLQMTFWKEPDGSFLWIDKKGIIVDSKILPNGRLSLEGNTIYLQTVHEKVMLGQKGGSIRNRDKLAVDRKDNGDRFRRWCEQPVQAYHALARVLFMPKMELEVSRWPCAEIKYPTADPFIGWDYFAHVHTMLPHFIEDKSRLYVELWETVDGKPHLTYDARITIALDEKLGMRQLTLTWPLAKVYCRCTEVNAKLKLDLFGDSRLCLPVKDRQNEESDDWLIRCRQVERKPAPVNPDYHGYR